MPRPNISKECFDAALIPGVRDRLAAVYRTLRNTEERVSESVITEKGEFVPGLAHTRDCPLCTEPSHNTSLVYHVQGMHIVRCKRCELVYSQEVINRDTDESRYRNSNVMSAHMDLHTHIVYAELELNKARYIVDRLVQARGGQHTSLLDIGCSTGALLQAATEVGWGVMGIEVNRAGSTIAKNRGYNVIDGIFPIDLQTGRLFDAITMLDVLEHTEDPVAFLTSVVERLSNNGIIGIQVPNFNSLLIRIEGTRNNNICLGHWSYFTPDTLVKTAKKVGLEMISIETIISEIDRIRCYPETQVCETAGALTGQSINFTDIDHNWLHDHLLGYKIFGVFRLA